MKGLLVTAAVVAIFVLACGEAKGPSQAESTASPMTTEPPTPTAPPDPTSPPWPTPPYDLAQRVASCSDPAANAQQLEIKLEGCPALQEFSARAIVAEGDVPVVLLDVGGGCTHYLESYVLWRQGDFWRVQSLESLLPNAHDFGTTIAGTWPYRPDGSYASGPTARVVEEGTIVRLGAIVEQAGCGSGPHESYVLLSLMGEEWSLSWDGNKAFFIGQTAVEFSGKSLDTIDVRGTSYGRADAKSGIFAEHKLAPIRRFEQVWERQGERYTLAEERVIPSATNTLLEFIYRLSSGDELGAADLVSDPSLVATAIEIGLLKDPGEPNWHVYCGDGSGAFAKGPCVVQAPDGRGFRFTMLEGMNDSIISAIDPCVPAYTPSECN